MIRRFRIATLALLAIAVFPAFATGERATWVADSDANARVLLEVMASLAPESAGRMGVDGLDEEISQIPLDANARAISALEGAIDELEELLAAERRPAVRQDLEIMLETARDSIATTQLNEAYNLPYFNVPQTVFQGLRVLLDERVEEERRAAALTRLRRYTGIEEGYEPIVEQAKTYIQNHFDRDNLRGPFRGELEKDLANTDRFIAGIEQLFGQFEIEGYEEAYQELQTQIADWKEFVNTEIAPRATDDFRLPPELYANNLKNVGVDMSASELQSRAKTSFKEIQNEMQAIAELIAAERDLDSSDYRDVIRALKQEQIVGEAILPHYQERMAELEELIAANDIVTLPEREARIRLASEAESAAIPAPHMSPPRLIGNTGEYGEFVLPLRIPSEDGEEDMGFDDFTFDAASWTLSVHEGRPGHEMQFASIIEAGVSIARALFAFNSVNVEGWALYTEAEMKPYLPLEGQLISLQHRLLRAARAHIDPGLQLGTIDEEEAYRVLEEDVVVSHAMAVQEVQRYTFWAPGQATSYFCGYQRLMELRTDTERKLGDAFDRKEFHDFVLSQGLLPPNLMRKAVMEEFVAPRLTTVAEPEPVRG